MKTGPSHPMTLLLIAVLSLAVLVVVPLGIPPYVLGILTLVLMWGAMASAFNILGGY